MEAPMEDSAAILHQISSLKDMLDQVTSPDPVAVDLKRPNFEKDSCY
jgi:hypothetical protein